MVVARYNENLNWLEDFKDDINFHIYNKGNDIIEYQNIKLPNIGREAHTYRTHIINNYDNLDEYEEHSCL